MIATPRQHGDDAQLREAFTSNPEDWARWTWGGRVGAGLAGSPRVDRGRADWLLPRALFTPLHRPIASRLPPTGSQPVETRGGGGLWDRQGACSACRPWLDLSHCALCAATASPTLPSCPRHPPCPNTRLPIRQLTSSFAAAKYAPSDWYPSSHSIYKPR